ncbi:MAG: NIL domain-containing protein, partial [Synergistaceae bacterium]|nr:NIL domain-containing protein [Synergistaceae bacterium]MBQ7170025.1 NIL domain-containing protein [Synergistaceae bacterium]
GVMVGGTVVIFSGDSDRISRAMQYYRDKNIRVEVLNDARADA